jgi:hypothetical protein
MLVRQRPLDVIILPFQLVGQHQPVSEMRLFRKGATFLTCGILWKFANSKKFPRVDFCFPARLLRR